MGYVSVHNRSPGLSTTRLDVSSIPSGPDYLDLWREARAPYVRIGSKTPDASPACAADHHVVLPIRQALRQQPLPHGPACQCYYLPALDDAPLPEPPPSAALPFWDDGLAP